jgi:hypothetical protein
MRTSWNEVACSDPCRARAVRQGPPRPCCCPPPTPPLPARSVRRAGRYACEPRRGADGRSAHDVRCDSECPPSVEIHVQLPTSPGRVCEGMPQPPRSRATIPSLSDEKWAFCALAPDARRRLRWPADARSLRSATAYSPSARGLVPGEAVGRDELDQLLVLLGLHCHNSLSLARRTAYGPFRMPRPAIVLGTSPRAEFFFLAPLRAHRPEV